MSVSGQGGVHARAADERDLARIHAIEVASFPDSWSLEGFRDLLRDSHARLEVAEDDAGEVLGYAAAWFVADESEIANLAVASHARRRGIGALLLDRILDAAASFGARSVFLEVRESNEAGKGLYSSRGFAVAGRRPRYYHEPDEDALIMKRTM
ncbi:MAG TPA: ribosomal protein S18-alanine N-acetyltransferase [Gemmatimonadaceae bacterium]|nr:ribosomal protein S18-alanine N-acetyltransferase [Gemmatimonadaceae bacterium]